MANLLHVIDLGGHADAADRIAAELAAAGTALPGVVSSVAGRTLPRALNGADLLWRLAFATEADQGAALASPLWRDRIAPLLSDEGVGVDRIAYRPSRSDASAGRDRLGLWRCLALAVDAGTPAATIRQFEKDIALMPAHVAAIRNWALCTVTAATGRRRWTHVWEQEFDDIAGLEGDYMLHPIHWGLVDGWFDPECPQRIVDPYLIHAAIPIREAVIG